MKRTAIARRTPIRRTSRLAARRVEPRRGERVVDLGYLHAVHALPCCARDLSPCRPFRPWTASVMRAWLDAQIEQTQAAMAATTSTAGAAGIEAA